ncbi:MAG: hypothetical protein ACO1QR_02730 [Chthoniobacteraceae bacterium]
MKRLVLLLLAAAALLPLAAASDISIPELLNPETRMRAFHEFMRKAHLDTEEFYKFAESYEILSLSTLQSAEQGRRYLLVWDWKAANEDAWNDPPLDDARRLIPRKSYYQVFNESGSPTGDSGIIWKGAVADLNGDGNLEEIVWESSNSPTIPGLDSAAPEEERKIAVDYLTIKSLDRSRDGTVQIIYNAHPASSAPSNIWNAQVIDRDEDGIYEVELGPLVDLHSLDVRAVIRWDTASKKWIAPEQKAGAHFALLEGEADRRSFEDIERKGLGYPLVASSSTHATEPTGADASAPVEPSKPYAYQSLRGRSNEEILRYMGQGRTAWELEAAQDEEKTAVPDFWKLSPRDAAIAYVRQNRPPELQSQFLVSTKAIGDEVPPEEGEFTLSDGPAGCFAAGGAYIHYLRCSKAGSFLVYAAGIQDWYQTPLTESGLRFDFRKLDLSYEEARHLLQTTWWLSGVRTQPLANRSYLGSPSDSTSDGSAAVEIQYGNVRQSIRATRLDPFPGRFIGSGDEDGIYNKSAFVTLVAKLFWTEVPNRFGDAWKEQAPRSRYTKSHTQAELDFLKARSQELLTLFRQKKVPPAVISQVVGAIGNFGWEEFRNEVASIPDLLPPLLEHERRCIEIDEALEKLQLTLGDGASRKAYDERWQKSLEPGGRAEPTPEDADRYAEVDRLFKESDDLRFNSPQWELEIAALRSEVPGTLRQLDSYHDAGALFRLGVENPFYTRFVLSRLKELDRPLAQLLLFMWEVTAETDEHREYYADHRISLQEPGSERTGLTAPDDLLDDRERKVLIARLTDSEASYESRIRALHLLVPRADVHRYPDREIDEALLKIITRSKMGTDLPPGEVAVCAALRLDTRAWTPLLMPIQSSLGLDPMPALTLIAQRHAEYREKLRPVLSAELKEPGNQISDALWSAWLLDFRDLAADVAAAATNSPEDYEGEHGRTSSTQRLLIKQRYHRARHVAALWNEEDPLTRAKLLIAFAAANAPEFEIGRESATERLQADLAKIWPTLSAAQQKELRDFTSWCEEHALTKLPGTIEASQLALVIESARSALK